MPITSLHFGILAPINHWLPRKVSNASFILVNLAIDAVAIQYWLFGLALPEHTPETHSFLGAWFTAAIIGIFGFKSLRWVLGSFLGAISHVLLDMLVHSEMLPFYQMKGNPFYLGWMEPLSMALLPLFIWLIVQYVSGTLDWVRTKKAVKPALTKETTS